jgi:hypothetical protein
VPPSGAPGGLPKVPGLGAKAPLPRIPSTVPKIPIPKIPIPPAGTTPSTGTPTTHSEPTPKKTTPAKGGEGEGGEAGSAQPEPLLLDTNAASTYNPAGYPASDFGEPGLAIDGDPTTSWTAKAEPGAAPRMAAGLAIDLKSKQRLGSLEVRTSTPGAAVEVYGATTTALPAKITDPAWVKLSSLHTLKHKTTLKLHDSTKAYRYLLLWLVKAPSPSGSAPGAGEVAVTELLPFPPAK